MSETETIPEPAPIKPSVLIEAYDEHWYKITEGDKTLFIPSVTTKLGIMDKPGLGRWRGDIGNREADLRLYDAGQRGTRIHWALKTLLEGGAVLYDPWNHPVYTEEGIARIKEEYGGLAIILRVQDEMMQVSKLWRQNKLLHPKIAAVEMTVWDLDHRDAGTLDHLYWIEEGDYPIAGRTPLHLEQGLYLGDLKTGNYLDENVWMQIAAYVYMYELRHGVQVKGGLVTHTSAKTKTGIAGLTTLFRDRLTLLEKDYPDYRHAAALWERCHQDDQPDQYEFPSLITF